MAAKFAAASTTVYNTGATTISPTIPAEAVDGSTVVALIQRTSALTPPSGWTEAVSAGPTSEADHWASIYYKVASSDASTSPTWTQASSGSIGLQYHVYTGGGTPTVHDTATLTDVVSASITIPNNGATTADAILLSCSAWRYSYSPSELALSAPFLQTSPADVDNNRLCAGYMPAVSGHNDWPIASSQVGDAGFEGVSSATAVITFANGISQEETTSVNSLPLLVLLAEASNTQVNSMVLMYLHRKKQRRLMGIID